MADITNGLPSYVVQAVGAATISYQYPLLLTGSGADNTLAASTSVALTGFKLNSTYADTAQAIQNSIIIPLLNGGSVQLTNNNTCGTLSIVAIRTSTSLGTGDVVSIASAQRDVTGGDGIGATITFSFPFNGKTFSIGFYNCTVAECKPIALAGNDAPDYAVKFNYSHYSMLS